LVLIRVVLALVSGLVAPRRLAARVGDPLLVLPKIGSVNAGRIFARCGIAHSKTLAGPTEWQRTELLNLLAR